MSNKKLYLLFYNGKISEGFSVKSVMDYIIKVQKVPKENLQKVARGEKLLILSSDEYEKIVNLDNEMRNNGAICDIEIIEKRELIDNAINDNKFLYQIIILILLSISATYLLTSNITISFISIILTSFAFIYPIIFEKEKHMMLFHDEKSTQSKIIQKMLNALSIILFVGISTSSITCPIFYADGIESQTLILFIFMLILMSSFLFMNHFKKSNDLKKSIKNIYYKKSIIIGLFFSIISNTVSKSEITYSAIKDLISKDICGVIQTLNSISAFIFSFLPSPYDQIISEIISFDIMSGYIFVTYGIAIYSVSHYFIYRNLNIFIWKK